MPLYEYQCTNCGETLELLQKFKDHAPKECLKCNAKNAFAKQVSKSGFVLKGGGWYNDLYSSPMPAKE